MKKCIYTLKDETEATFSKEHIFPCSIGGTETLPKDWVSQEFNNLISSAEREFSRNEPFIVLPRMINPHTGRNSNRGIVGVGFLQNKAENILLLGYISESIPSPISQLIIEISDLNNKECRPLPCIIQEFGKEVPITESLSNFDRTLEPIQHDVDEFKNILFIGFTKKQAYVGTHNSIGDQPALRYAKTVMTLISEGMLNPEFPSNLKEIRYFSHYQRIVNFNPEKVQRVYAKIVFNVLAKIKGQDFVLRHEFDEIRTAILTGAEINKLVSYRQLNLTKEINELFKLNGYEHFVYIKMEKDELLGLINLFGTRYGLIMIVLSRQFNEIFEPRLYICDWKQKKEWWYPE